MAYDDDSYFSLDEFPSRLDGQELVDNRQQAVKLDLQWRRKHTDMQKCELLYESRTSDSAIGGPTTPTRHQTTTSRGVDDPDVPRVNKIQQAVDDYMSVALQNLPDAKLKATRQLGYFENPLKRAVMAEKVTDSEDVLNAYISEILKDNQYQDEIEEAVRQSAIYGVGYMKVNIDSSMDTRKSSEARRLLSKPMDEWTREDAERYQMLSKRVNIEHVDSRDVVVEHGRRSFDEEVLRVSVVERASTQALRTHWNNDQIRPGQYPFYINEDPNNRGDITAVITTWELEPVHVTKQRASGARSKFTAWKMVKTKIAGDQLLEKEVIDPGESPARLPVVPIYLRKAQSNPYGDPIPLKLETSESFINLMRVILYKSAKNAVSSQAALVNANELTENDRKRVNRVLNDGGAAAIEGNTDGPVSNLENIVYPLNTNNSTLSGAPVEGMRNEERVFQDASNSLDMDALRSSDSGAAKRAQIMAADRPKGISLGLLSTSVEWIYDNVFELIQLYHSGESRPATVRTSDGRRQEVRLNQRVEDEIPVMDREGRVFADPSQVSQKNPLGLMVEKIEYHLNDTSMNMRAEAEGRGDLPTDPINRFNMLMMYVQAGAITQDTLRELQLSRRLKAVDDKNRRKAQQKQRRRQRALKQRMAQMMQAQQNGGMQNLQQQNPQMRPQEEVPRAAGSQRSPMIENQNQQQAVPGALGTESQEGDGILALQSQEGAEGSRAGGVTPQEMVGGRST